MKTRLGFPITKRRLLHPIRPIICAPNRFSLRFALPTKIEMQLSAVTGPPSLEFESEQKWR